MACGNPKTKSTSGTYYLLSVDEGDSGEYIPVADTFFKRLWGLMGKDVRTDGDGLFLADCVRVHTCFMKCSIDVLYLGPDLRVLDAETLVPWRMGKKVRGARHVLELPAGRLDGADLSTVVVMKAKQR